MDSDQDGATTNDLQTKSIKNLKMAGMGVARL